MKKYKEEKFDMRPWGDRFDYSGFSGYPAHCYIKQNGNVILCTESPENDGTSITNMAEGIATLVCQKYGISFDQLIWIEHYINLSDGETFDFVTFQVEGNRLVHPKWKYAGRAEANKFIEILQKKSADD